MANEPVNEFNKEYDRGYNKDPNSSPTTYLGYLARKEGEKAGKVLDGMFRTTSDEDRAGTDSGIDGPAISNPINSRIFVYVSAVSLIVWLGLSVLEVGAGTGLVAAIATIMAIVTFLGAVFHAFKSGRIVWAIICLVIWPAALLYALLLHLRWQNSG